MADQVTYSKVIMVSGSGRSGTNVTKKIFGEHRDIATLPFEYRFVIDPGGIIDFYNSYAQVWSPYWPDAKIRALRDYLLSLASMTNEKSQRVKAAKSNDPVGLNMSPPSYSGWELDKWIPGFSANVDELIEELVSFRYRAIWPGTPEGMVNNEMLFAPAMEKAQLAVPLRNFLEKCVKAILNKQEKGVFLEDNTHNILFASDLMALMPNAKLLHLVRDPRDVIASARQQRWCPTDITQLISWYAEIMNRWWAERAKCNPERFLEVRFEDLVHDRTTRIAEMAAFCDVPMDERMLNVALSRHNIGRHKEDLTEEEIHQIESALHPFFEAYGYA